MLYRMAYVLGNLILRLCYSVEIMFEANPSDLDGGAIVCSNHTRYLDPIIIGTTLPKQVRFMAKKELFNGKLKNYFLTRLGAFPVSRGENDIKSMKTAIQIVKDGGVLGLFPEGTRNITGEDMEAKAGVGFIVAKTGRPVIPITIRGGKKFRSKLLITVGKAIDFSEYAARKLNSEDYRTISGMIMDRIRAN